MFSIDNGKCSPESYEKSNLKSIYRKFQNLLEFGVEALISVDRSNKNEMMSSRGSTANSEESFITSASSMADLMTMSPRVFNDNLERPDKTSDFLTGSEFDTTSDITIQEMPSSACDDILIDSKSLDYLVKCAESSHVQNHIDRGKESLMVKFDPLYARQKQEKSISSNTGSVSDSTDCDVGYETSSGISDNHVVTPRHSKSMNSIQLIKDKPMQVVPPVKNYEMPRTVFVQTPALVRSLSAILTPTQVATDRLISISGNTPPRAAPRSPRYKNPTLQDSDHLHSLRTALLKQEQEILKLRQDNREKDLTLQHMQDMAQQSSRTIANLEKNNQKLTAENVSLLAKLNDKILGNKQMSIVMEEYEKTISMLIDEQQKSKIQHQELASEKEEVSNHLATMEISFNDLLSKYEKCKSTILEYKDREKILEQNISEYEQGMKKYDDLYNSLKQDATDKLEKANETHHNIIKNHSVEVAKLNATIKKYEVKIASLEESLSQKKRNIEELTRLCDQLINEVH